MFWKSSSLDHIFAFVLCKCIANSPYIHIQKYQTKTKCLTKNYDNYQKGKRSGSRIILVVV